MSEQPTQFTCFHCWEQFDASTLEGQRVARDHFGWAVHAEPACLIKRDERQLVFRIRAQEDQLARLMRATSSTPRIHFHHEEGLVLIFVTQSGVFIWRDGEWHEP